MTPENTASRMRTRAWCRRQPAGRWPGQQRAQPGQASDRDGQQAQHISAGDRRPALPPHQAHPRPGAERATRSRVARASSSAQSTTITASGPIPSLARDLEVVRAAGAVRQPYQRVPDPLQYPHVRCPVPSARAGRSGADRVWRARSRTPCRHVRRHGCPWPARACGRHARWRQPARRRPGSAGRGHRWRWR